MINANPITGTIDGPAARSIPIRVRLAHRPSSPCSAHRGAAQHAVGQGALTAVAGEAWKFHHVIYARRASLTRTNNMMENPI